MNPFRLRHSQYLIVIVTVTIDNEDEYTFEKLKGAKNYKEGIREMSFALRDAGLMGYVKSTVRKPTLDDKDLEQIAKKEKIIDTGVRMNDRAVNKLGKMSSKAVQLKFKDHGSARNA